MKPWNILDSVLAWHWPQLWFEPITVSFAVKHNFIFSPELWKVSMKINITELDSLIYRLFFMLTGSKVTDFTDNLPVGY